MTITVKEVVGREGKAEATGEREYIRTFLAVVPDADLPVTEVDVTSVAPCPLRYDPIGPQDPGARCTHLDAAEYGSVNLWKITARYSTRYGNEEVTNEPNPLLRPVVWDYATQRMMRTDAQDRKGNPYCTPVVLEPFASPPESPYAVAKWTVQKNYLWWDADLATTYAYTVNNAAWKGQPQYSVLCDGITAKEVWENDYYFHTLTFTFLVDRRYLWQPVEIASKGYRYLDAPGGSEVESNTLVWIATDGTKSAVPVYLERYPFGEATFSAFPI